MASKIPPAILRSILEAREMNELSLYIRVGNSILYDYNRGVRATLKEIAFMTSNGRKKPEGSHFDEYEGWCWASQIVLAERVGCSERQIAYDVEQFLADGVIETRTWHDRWGHPHREYRVIPEVVDANQRVEGQERKRPTSRVYKANKGSFKTVKPRVENTVQTHSSSPNERVTTKLAPKMTPVEANPPAMSATSHLQSQPQPSAISATSHLQSHALSLAEIAVKGVGLVRGVDGRLEGSISALPLRGIDEVNSLRSSQTKTKATPAPQGFGLVSKTTAKPTPTPKLQTFDYLEEDVDICTECAVAKGHAKTCSKNKAKAKAAGFDLGEI
jgi:hypothetical protein